MVNRNIAPEGVDPVEIGIDEPEDVSESIQEWEKSLLTLQKNKDVEVIDTLIASKTIALAATGARVSLADNAQGARTQYGLEQSLQALQSAKASILNAPLADVKYADEE